MRVRMKVYISGTRCGVEWPPRGSVIELPDAEAMDYIRGGLAEAVTDFRDAETAVLTEEEVRGESDTAVAPEKAEESEGLTTKKAPVRRPTQKPKL